MVTGTIGVFIAENGGVIHMVLGPEYGRHCTVTARTALSHRVVLVSVLQEFGLYFFYP